MALLMSIGHLLGFSYMWPVKLWLALPLLLLWLSPQAFKSNHLLVFRLFLSFGSQNVPLGFHANCFTLFHTTSKVLRKGKSSVWFVSPGLGRRFLSAFWPEAEHLAGSAGKWSCLDQKLDPAPFQVASCALTCFQSLIWKQETIPPSYITGSP